MSKNSQAVATLSKQIVKAVKNICSNLFYDRTVIGKVVSRTISGISAVSYVVSIEGTKLTVAGKGVGSYDVNDIVYVFIPNNNLKNAYIKNPNPPENLLTIIDTRNDNFSPSYYMKNKLGGNFQVEFKFLTTVNNPVGLTGSYCTLFTVTPWRDTSGGYPTQIAIASGKLATRYGTGDESWSGWTAIS